MDQLISTEERKRRELLLQTKYQTIILDHIARSKLESKEYEALTTALVETKKLFRSFLNHTDEALTNF